MQLRLPWLPGFEPWVRVAVPVAGSNRGFWLIPQVNDEVLVAFDGGDVNSPYVIGSLWNGSDRPPTTSSEDARSKTILHTPRGHVIELDDDQQTVKITTSGNQKATLGPMPKTHASAVARASVSRPAWVMSHRTSGSTATASRRSSF